MSEQYHGQLPLLAKFIDAKRDLSVQVHPNDEMAMGLLDLSSPESTQAAIKEFSERHEGCTDCRDLLRLAAEHGIERHENCDGLVYEGVETVEKLLAERA